MSELRTQCHGSWQVESSSCIQKRTLEIRWLFHWTQNPVCARIAICYMAFRYLHPIAYGLRMKCAKLSSERIRGAIDGPTTSWSAITATDIAWRTPHEIASSLDLDELLRVLGNVVTEEYGSTTLMTLEGITQHVMSNQNKTTRAETKNEWSH